MRRVTLMDVSERAGVSRATASLVVRGSSRVSVATAERVRAAMVELGYVYDRTAAQLRGAKTMTVGVIVPEIRNPYLAELLMTIEQTLRRSGYTSLISHTGDDAAREMEIMATMAERRVDGILVHPAPRHEGIALDRHTAQFGIPIVTMLRRTDERFSYVGPDYRNAGQLLGAHLRTVGARSVALVGGPLDSSARRERVAGLRDGLGEAIVFDAGEDISTPTNYADAGQVAMAQVFDRGQLPDGVVGYSDILAMGMYMEITRRGLAPGQDVAMASFDDIMMSSWLSPPLTSVAMWPDHVGLAAAQILLEAITDGPRDQPANQVIKPALRLRNSTLCWHQRPGRPPSPSAD